MGTAVIVEDDSESLTIYDSIYRTFASESGGTSNLDKFGTRA